MTIKKKPKPKTDHLLKVSTSRLNKEDSVPQNQYYKLRRNYAYNPNAKSGSVYYG